MGPEGVQQFNVVTLRLRHPVVASLRRRRFVATASCGLCGKTALDDLEVRCDSVAKGPTIAASIIRTLPGQLGDAQAVFDMTGGLHAAATFDAGGTRLVSESLKTWVVITRSTSSSVKRFWGGGCRSRSLS